MSRVKGQRDASLQSTEHQWYCKQYAKIRHVCILKEKMLQHMRTRAPFQFSEIEHRFYLSNNKYTESDWLLSMYLPRFGQDKACA